MKIATLLFAASFLASGCDVGSRSSAESSSGSGTTTGGDGGGGSTGTTIGEDTPDVCGFAEVPPEGPPDAEGLIDLSPRHPLIRYSGRIDCTSPDGPAFAWPGAAVRVRFRGTAMQMKLRDHGNGSAVATNYYNVLVDGGAPTVLEVSPTKEVYDLAKDLPEGEHSVELQKRVESAPGGNAGAGKGELLGLRVPQGTELLKVPAFAHRIEIIGDSISCGYGNEVSTMTPDMAPYTSKAENAFLTYGAVTARNLGADLMVVAYSGRGMYRNFSGGSGEPLPGLYLRTLPDEPNGPTWEVSRYTPDAVVVNLGTNDFSPGGVDRAEYRAAYLDFLTKLRGYYPAAAIVAAIGPMLSDYYPPGEMAWTSAQADVQEVVQQRKDAGDADIHYLAFAPQTGPWGEDYHPTAATHAAMADKLTELLASVGKF